VPEKSGIAEACPLMPSRAASIRSRCVLGTFPLVGEAVRHRCTWTSGTPADCLSRLSRILRRWELGVPRGGRPATGSAAGHCACRAPTRSGTAPGRSWLRTHPPVLGALAVDVRRLGVQVRSIERLPITHPRSTAIPVSVGSPLTCSGRAATRSACTRSSRRRRSSSRYTSVQHARPFGSPASRLGSRWRQTRVRASRSATSVASEPPGFDSGSAPNPRDS
jgi:hypothetical protein